MSMVVRPPRSTLFPYTDALPIYTPIIFIEARINLSRFVVTGCAAKTSATVTTNLLKFMRSEERFSRNAETDIVCRLLLEKKKGQRATHPEMKGGEGGSLAEVVD